ncbi:hypothetical protein EXU48_11720 [Occultella glacieicola]|uniref:SRPBCC family protein n=1 Tax=Occultella glacieicola TaxID=2518684 RepID=A0ABY2E398_9MICO|nr:hypothetical protein [Occultella glacieicola]TDE94107.1 hypothetical protein EXU48_11720 [Occultella glacieicola]
MPATVTSRVIGLDAVALFDRVTALANHERLIPLTRVHAPHRRPRVGDRVVATSAGVLRDVMLLTQYERPDGVADPRSAVAGVGRAVYRKLGPVLLGRAEIVVTALGPATARVDWTEDVRLVDPWRPAEAIVCPLLAVMTARALRLLAEATDGERG